MTSRRLPKLPVLSNVIPLKESTPSTLANTLAWPLAFTRHT